MKLIISILIVLIIPAIFFRLKCFRRYKGPASSHFNGTRFYNETGVPSKSFWAIIKWLVTRHNTPWPINQAPSSNHSLPTPTEGQCVVTFINHSCSLVQTGKINILTDPHFSGRASPVSWAGPFRVNAPGIAYDKLPHIDVVIISHDHYDHMDKQTLKMLHKDHKPLFLVGLGNDVHFKSFGITDNVKILDWWQPIQVANIFITFVPAQHFSGRGVFDHNTTLWGGYVMQINKASLFFAGDTGYSPHFKTICERFGPMDLSLLPIGAFCPRWFMKPMHVNPEEAVLAHLDLQSKKSIGIHFKTFQLSDESYEQPVIELEVAKQKYNIPSEDFIAPEFGQHFILSTTEQMD